MSSLQRSPSFASLFSQAHTNRAASLDQFSQASYDPSLMSTVMSSRHVDGPTNITMNTQHLRIDTKEQRRDQYVQFVDPHRQLVTAAGQVLPFNLRLSRTNLFHHQVKKWLKDGQVSVATHPCTQCVEMNSLRPDFQPPMCCIVRSKFKVDSGDGTAACAVCYAMGKFQCGSRVNRRNSLESKALPRIRTVSTPEQPPSLQVDSPTIPTSTDLYETMASADDVQGTLSPRESILKNNRYSGKSPAFLSTSEDLLERGPSYSHSHTKDQPLQRSLTDASRRRHARFSSEIILNDQAAAIDSLMSQVEALQKNWVRQSDKLDDLEDTLSTQGAKLVKIQQKSEEQSQFITKLQANNTDQTSSNFHLARLIEVVDDLQRSIVAQKTDIQALKQGSPALQPKTDLVSREPFAEDNNTIDELRRFIDETEDKQRQRKAVYLEHLNRELQRTMHTGSMGSMSRKIDLLPRSFDP